MSREHGPPVFLPNSLTTFRGTLNWTKTAGIKADWDSGALLRDPVSTQIHSYLGF